MAERVSLALYDIDRCGYYPFQEATPILCNVACAFADLRKWVADRDLEKTCPVEVEDEESMPTYCFDLTQHGARKSYLLTLFNRTSKSDVLHVSGKSKVGNADVTLAKIDEGSIPGVPSYFWVIPERNAMVTVRPTGLTANRDSMMKYMRNFLMYWTPHVVKDEPSKYARSVRVSVGGKDEGNVDLYPRFSSTPVVDKSAIEFIRQHREEITAIYARHKITAQAGAASQGMSGRIEKLTRAALETVGIIDAPLSSIHEVPLSYTMRYQPSAAELEKMITFATTSSSKADNVGLKLQSESSIFWLRDTKVRYRDAKTNVRSKNGVFNGAPLLKWLEDNYRESVEARLESPHVSAS